MPCVVAVNRFPNDTDEEVELVRTLSLEAGAMDAQHNTAVVDGGEGAADLARAVVKAANDAQRLQADLPGRRLDRGQDRRDRDQGLRRRRRRVPARGARPSSKRFAELGYGSLPICMAKTHLSISHDPSVQGAPTGFTVPIRDLRAYTGAGFVTALCGTIVQMPGLGKTPAGPEHRHRRSGTHGRAVLAGSLERAVSRSFRRQAHPREGRRAADT